MKCDFFFTSNCCNEFKLNGKEKKDTRTSDSDSLFLEFLIYTMVILLGYITHLTRIKRLPVNVEIPFNLLRILVNVSTLHAVPIDLFFTFCNCRFIYVYSRVFSNKCKFQYDQLFRCFNFKTIYNVI
jgi:hypothetical protein